MLSNYLKITFRNLRQNPGYAFINITGLALGICVAILMLVYAVEEFGFDRFHRNADRIYRLTETVTAADGSFSHFPSVMGPAGPALVETVPEISKSVRMRGRFGYGRFVLEQESRRFLEEDYLFAEASIFEIFDFPLARGNADAVLQAPRSVVLTHSAAKRYFGDSDPLGMTLQWDRDDQPLTVTGLMPDPPANSHLQFNMLISFTTLSADSSWNAFINNWESTSFITYVLARAPLDLDATHRTVGSLVAQQRGEAREARREIVLQPLTDVHFGSAHLQFDRNFQPGSRRNLMIFGLIALFVLLIACINYMNLATAWAMRRGREIGLRKTVGAARRQIVAQFLSESIVVSAAALLIAIALIQVALPTFNAVAERQLTLASLFSGPFPFVLLIIAVAVGVLGGSYPAVYLSALRPGQMFKDHSGSGARAGAFRKALVVLQFVLSIIMIVSTVTALEQLRFVQEKDLGFNQEQLVVVDINSGTARRQFEAIRTAMHQVPGVQAVSVTSRVPGEWKNLTEVDMVPEGGDARNPVAGYFIGADSHFLDTFEITLLSGRNFSPVSPADTAAVLLNETAVRLLGWDDPVNRVLNVPGSSYTARVIGVVKDFHYQSLHRKIAPMLIGHWNNPVRSIDYFTARVAPGTVSLALDGLRRVHEQFDPTRPFEYNFLDARVASFYATDTRIRTIVTFAAGLTVFIACLGLFGLATHAAERRTKELGVRKVLGASAFQIVALLSREFGQLVLIAALIAVPVAYFGIEEWLQNFAYRISVGPGIFVAAAAVALVVAMLSVSYRAIRAALANPVHSLRHE